MRKETNALDLIRLKSMELVRRRTRRTRRRTRRRRKSSSINRSCADWPGSIDAD